MDEIAKIQVIDSHTGGEPTRVVMGGIPDLGVGSMRERADRFAKEFDWFRSAVNNEPRGNDVLVSALLVEPFEPGADVGVIYFNNVGLLGMCGHGTIGVVETLKLLGKFSAGTIKLDTVAGVVSATAEEDGWISVENVPAYRYRKDVAVEVPGHGRVTGDVAYGGNWFFLCADHGQDLSYENAEVLTAFTWAIRKALESAGIEGEGGGLIDHIELFGAPDGDADSRNFVLCPGKAYDRSPCGTGTSAKLACLAADGKLKPGEVWRQESVTGSVFEGSYEDLGDGKIKPTIRGQAWITAESTLWLDSSDPLKHGVRVGG